MSSAPPPIASGNLDVMAAVMIGGMVPPLAIALCATFFKKKFSKDERKSGLVNYIMGLCFITEGAIPFAAADPLRVMPLLHCRLSGGWRPVAWPSAAPCAAPHGGAFVFPVVGNVLGYIVALLIGSLVGMVLLALLKKNKAQE